MTGGRAFKSSELSPIEISTSTEDDFLIVYLTIDGETMYSADEREDPEPALNSFRHLLIGAGDWLRRKGLQTPKLFKHSDGCHYTMPTTFEDGFQLTSVPVTRKFQPDPEE